MSTASCVVNTEYHDLVKEVIPYLFWLLLLWVIF